MSCSTWGLLIAVMLTALGGCASAPSAPSHVKPSTGAPNKVLDESAAQARLQEAVAMIQAGDYNTVISRLVQILSNYPATETAKDVRFWLGVAHYKVSSYRDASQMLREYVKIAPNGKHVEDAKKYLAELNEEYEKKFTTPDELNRAIAALIDELKQHPGQVQKQIELADLLWKRGDYENGGRLYENILKAHPEYARDKVIASRIERLPNNGYILLTPAEIQRREIENKPLQVINVNSFRSNKDLITREDLFYVVTGQAFNRGESVLYGVQIIVTIYGLGNVVYDTVTQNIGRLSPGEMRAFSVRFSTFDNIENIQRHECIGTFER